MSRSLGFGKNQVCVGGWGQPYKIADEDHELFHLGECIIDLFILWDASVIFFMHAPRSSPGWELRTRAWAFEPEKQEMDSWSAPLCAP